MIAQKVDANARKRFQSELSGYAGISAINALNYAPCLNKRIADFRNGKRGARDSVRAAIHFEASQLKNAMSRVLSFHLAIESMGYDGTCAPEEILAAGVVSSTGGLCAKSTYREALAELCRRGWLSKTLVPTGTRVIVDDIEGDPIWKTLKVNKTSLTRAGKMLISRKSPTSSPTLSHISLPRQKSATTVGDEGTTSTTSCSPRQIDQNLDSSRPSQKGRSKESTPSVDESTRPMTAQRSSTVKHRTSKSATRKTAKNKAVVKSSARQGRNKAPNTWDSSRKLLLRDLFAYLHDHPLRDEIVRTARLQTSRSYPSACLSVTNWDKWVWKWPEMSWHDARRAIKNQLLPRLSAFCDDLRPPDTQPLQNHKLDSKTRSKINTALESHRRLSEWLRVIPEKLPSNIPDVHRNTLERERWRLNRLLYAIHTGRMSLKDLSDDDHKILCLISQCRGISA